MNMIQTSGEFGTYEADPLRLGQLAAQYYGNVNGNWTTLKRIAESRLGHEISRSAETMELLTMLASDDGQRMSSDELRDALAADEFNN